MKVGTFVIICVTSMDAWTWPEALAALLVIYIVSSTLAKMCRWAFGVQEAQPARPTKNAKELKEVFNALAAFATEKAVKEEAQQFLTIHEQLQKINSSLEELRKMRIILERFDTVHPISALSAKERHSEVIKALQGVSDAVANEGKTREATAKVCSAEVVAGLKTLTETLKAVYEAEKAAYDAENAASPEEEETSETNEA